MFPNSSTKESRVDKITLARMCRASKMLCSIAQPVLFHYYASGNLARSVRTDFYEYERSWNVEGWNPEDDKLPAFLRTLITRPDLALCVELLQVQGSGVEDICSPEHMRLLSDASRALNFKLPVGWRCVSWAEDLRGPFLYTAIPGGAPGLTVTHVPASSWKCWSNTDVLKMGYE
ncbi:hypothetical protein V500_07773 [Pseudogymnoascus sp. VKM F-4518 (FW-2643)]|nr:hypothetical protein V500_07773 [Pseudogymnoascus sp. VKM F-4518 (FW-2643)]